LGGVEWHVSHSAKTLFQLSEFLYYQNHSNDDIDFIRKIPQKRSWKNYLDFHRHVLVVENSLRGFLQSAELLNQNSIDILCGLFQVCHIDGRLCNNVSE
jgi:hypothetical protein